MPASPETFDTPFSVPYRHRVLFTNDCFDAANSALASLFVETGTETNVAPRRAIVLVDGGVADAWPDLSARVEKYFSQHPALPQLSCIERTSPGEEAKQTPELANRVVELVNKHGIDRQSYVISIGGGAVQDAVGFGASVAHRGCRMVRIATTTLAQDDAAMAVKCGINTNGKKNFTGTFAVPWGVVCDHMFLSTLPKWSWCGGFSEAVKIALLKDASLFARIERDASRICARDMTAAAPVIARSAELHYRHIVLGGDPFETHSARPLDYGHWVAHRLESLTKGGLPHGQAVSIGVALDTLYSACAGMISMDDAMRVVHTLRSLELPTTHELLAKVDRVTEGLEEFREHLGGRLTLTLLTGIGSAVDVHELRPDLLAKAIEMTSRL